MNPAGARIIRADACCIKNLRFCYKWLDIFRRPVHAAEDVSKSSIIIKVSVFDMSHGFRCNNNWVMTNPDQKLSVSFWDYLGARLAIRKAPAIPPLPDLIRARCATA